MSLRRPAVAILTHAADCFSRRRYLIKPIIAKWQAMDFNVFVTTDEEPFVPADLALLHVGLSIVPEATRRLAGRYPRVLNGPVVDIRKRKYSRLLVDREGPDPGMVMVKTDWNCGGEWDFRQRVLASRMTRWLGRLRLDRMLCRALVRLEEKRSWTRRRWLAPHAYRVFSSRDDVPAEVWTNPNLIVERFIAERQGEYYCCRHWLFFGDREVGRRTMSIHPVVKAADKLEPLSDPVPAELRAIRRELGFDYGKFDYGIADGRVVLYDINRTPGITSDPGRHTDTIRVLSEGLDVVLADV